MNIILKTSVCIALLCSATFSGANNLTACPVQYGMCMKYEPGLYGLTGYFQSVGPVSVAGKRIRLGKGNSYCSYEDRGINPICVSAYSSRCLEQKEFQTIDVCSVFWGYH